MSARFATLQSDRLKSETCERKFLTIRLRLLEVKVMVLGHSHSTSLGESPRIVGAMGIRIFNKLRILSRNGKVTYLCLIGAFPYDNICNRIEDETHFMDFLIKGKKNIRLVLTK